MRERVCAECDGSGEVPDPEGPALNMETCLNCWGLGWVEVFGEDDLPLVPGDVEWDCD